ncbi:MAG: hypothetical protein ABFS41_16895, partial [Myxococcota bacterium]
VLAERRYQRFGEIALVQPLEAQLREKQQRMNEALEAFDALVDYEVGEVTAAATYYMAEIYGDFSDALNTSERPSDLGPAELAAYELALEEEAFPFEEQAIEVHEKNLELLRGGLYNAWIEKSLARLATLMPGRYAKPELSSGLLASVEGYAYQPPVAPTADVAPPPVAPTADVAPPPAAPEAAPEPDVAPPAALAEDVVDPEEVELVAPPDFGEAGPALETEPAADWTAPAQEAEGETHAEPR